MMKANANIEVRFLTAAEGGRNRAIESKNYGCPLVMDSQAFDCRFVLTDVTRFDLGQTYVIPIKFLDSNNAMKILHEGMAISLWEGKTIAEGKLINLFEHESTPIIYADFNNIDSLGRIRLNSIDTIGDIKKLSLKFTEGDSLVISDGEKKAKGTLELSCKENIWVLSIDEGTLINT